MHARMHMCMQAQAALYRVPLLSAKQLCHQPGGMLHPYPNPYAGRAKMYEEQRHTAQSCHSPELTLVSLASDGSPGKPQAQGRPYGMGTCT